jgi:probable phosphoglycerate mutase
MRLYFVRHGESEANLLGEISNRGLKHGLTGRGRAQAAACAAALKDAGIEKIYSSPLLRAVQTAEILAGELSVPYETTGALREFDCGILEGKSDPASWAIHVQTREAWLLRREWDRRIEQGESFLDIQARFVPFLEGLRKEARPTSGGLVLVGHGGLFLTMLPLVLANVTFEQIWELPLDHAAPIVAEPRGDSWVCVEWGGKAVL